VETILIEVPARHKCFAEAVQAASAELVAMEKEIRGGRTVDAAKMEERSADAAASVERAMLGELLGRLDVDEPQVVIEGRRYARVGRYKMTYYSMPGPIEVERSIYRPLGERNAATVDPIALRAGLIGEGWLPATARAIAQRLAIGTSREAESISALERRIPYSRTSIEEVGHLVGEAVVTRRESIEQALIETMPIPEGTASLGISLDRASMAFEEPRKRPPGRPRKDAPKRPISRVYHMAWSGTLTFHDHEGTVIHTIHYGREPSEGATLCESLVSDALAIRLRRPELPITVLGDGAHELWHLFEHELAAVTDVTYTVDYWHLVQKLSAAASAMTVNEAEREELMGRWRFDLLNRDCAATRILYELLGHATHPASGEVDTAVHEATTYLTNHAARTSYASNRRRGLPIGSGPVEANAKSIYFIRMKRPGARWKVRTADHILQLRGHLLSQRLVPAVNMALPKPQVVRKAA
jgi:hypothetical protein